MRRWLHEPLLHFILLGGLAFEPGHDRIINVKRRFRTGNHTEEMALCRWWAFTGLSKSEVADSTIHLPVETKH